MMSDKFYIFEIKEKKFQYIYIYIYIYIYKHYKESNTVTTVIKWKGYYIYEF